MITFILSLIFFGSMTMINDTINRDNMITLIVGLFLFTAPIICMERSKNKPSLIANTKKIQKKNIKINNIIVVGLTGRKRSGKDTTGHHLIEKYGFVRIAFADALKEACKSIFDFSDDQVYGDELKDNIDDYWGHSPREILQLVGTELFRDELPKLCKNISDDIWIRSVERKIQNLQKKGYTRFVITDIRYPNEAEFVKNINGNIWKIHRPSMNENTSNHSSEPLTKKIWKMLSFFNIYNSTNNHSSETLIDKLPCDIELTNNSTIEQLYTLVDTIMTNVNIK